ncbi:CHC2 zinc finger domain-containing protein [Nocardia salmonicida]|uniref:CHC2 zinc finger domain-containing protein n=1 Tax=Nocardia salmonicida TaxID=53431 RepID=UPI0033F8B711
MDVPIVRVIHEYHGGWLPPDDTGREWIKTLCPFHDESVASATVSYENNAFCCFACGVKGDVYAIIMREENVSFAKAKRIAAAILAGCDTKLREQPPRKSGRRVFGESRTTSAGSARQAESTGLRRKPSPWA